MNTVRAIRIATASIWFVFGLVFKVLDLVPRHRQIVASVLGDEVADLATVLIGAGEVGIGLWILSGYRPRLCAAVQTLAIAAMNLLELRLAPHLLVSPIAMVFANLVFLAVVWFGAFKATAQERQGQAGF